MLKTIIEMLDALDKNVEYCLFSNNTVLDITVIDFEGITANGEELYVDYDEDAVDALFKWLEQHCNSQDEGFYYYYHFDGFTIVMGFASMDL